MTEIGITLAADKIPDGMTDRLDRLHRILQVKMDQNIHRQDLTKMVLEAGLKTMEAENASD